MSVVGSRRMELAARVHRRPARRAAAARIDAPALGRFGSGKGPVAVEDLRSWPIQAHGVVPAVHDGQTVGSIVGTAAEVDRDRSVVVGGRSDVVDAVDIVLVRFEVAAGLYTEIDQNPSTGTSRTLSRYRRPGVRGRR